MESLPAEKTQPRSGTTWSRSRDAVAPDPEQEPRFTDPAVRARLRLQQRASANLRRHLTRAIRRVVVLLFADLSAFALTRGTLRALRDYDLLGSSVANVVGSLFPRGILSGFQFAAALLVALAVTGNYGPGDQRRDARRLFLAAALATALPLWMTVWTHGLGGVLVQYALTTLLIWAALVAERFTIDRAVARMLSGSGAVRALFVGQADSCRLAMTRAVFRKAGDYRVVGFVDAQQPTNVAALGHIARFPELLQESGAETVVVCGYLSDAVFQTVVDASVAAGTQILAVPRAIDIAGVAPETVWRNGQPLIELTTPSLQGQQLVLKRLLDIVGVSVLLIVLSPVFLLLGLLIRLGSRGPVFFTQQRVGRGGQPFRIIKFRTMIEGAEEQRDELLPHSVYPDARLFKVPGDPRITRLGRWLRRSSLDELPQLVNVLRGEMSLVGPRPPLPSEVALYDEHHYARFAVPPGITGPWQVSGRNTVTDFEQVIALEREYIRDWSLATDLWILLRTVPVVLRRSGAH